jgi:hypothetical protein
MFESERAFLVRKYHRKQRIPLPNAQLHALTHVIVENQVAEGDQYPVAATLSRLMGEGLTRHEAIHAIGSVLAAHMVEALKNPPSGPGELSSAYFRELQELTAKSWLEMS